MYVLHGRNEVGSDDCDVQGGATEIDITIEVGVYRSESSDGQTD